MWTREMLKSNAKEIFRRNYWPCVGVSLILGAVSGGGGGSIGSAASNGASTGYRTNTTMSYNGTETYYSGGDITFTLIIAIICLVVVAVALAVQILLGNVLTVGGCRFFILNRSMKGTVGNVVDGFKSGCYWNIVKTILVQDLIIVLWSLLLIVPGIIKSYELKMVPYILAENPSMDRKEVFAISKRMMDGQKWAAFVLDLSFIGWDLLSVITCGIVAIFYVAPYRHATYAELYTYNKVQAYNEGYIK